MAIVYKKAPVLIRYDVKEVPQTPGKMSVRKLVPIILVTLGSMLIANVSWPIISYLITSSPYIQLQKTVSPLTDDSTLQFSPIALEVQKTVPKVEAKAVEEQQVVAMREGPEIISEELDYTNLSNWFPTTQQMPQSDRVSGKVYTIEIPALQLTNMKVEVGETDLSKALIHYPGTANPGELGAPVIFGHSTNPLFYSPSERNPKRYTSIFTKLMTLKKDDKIYISYDGVQYVYRVVSKMEVSPEDTYILQQRHDTRELKLVTCTPPGTYLKRGIILAQLEDVK